MAATGCDARNTLLTSLQAIDNLRKASPLLTNDAMRKLVFVIGLTIAAFLSGSSSHSEPTAVLAQTNRLQPNSLCARDERIIFSCPIRRPAKIVSLCASKNLTADQGYLQYRFGLPGKVELEFPKDRTGTQQKFQYMHYFRARFDLTEISFNIDGYEYQITDDYNAEEKSEQIVQGVSVKAPSKDKETSLSCRTKPKADYADLQAVLPNGQ